MTACVVRSSPQWPDALEGMSRMNKRQLIEDIRKFNTTVPPQFLAQFDDGALRQYLEHLEGARRKHLRNTSITRRDPKLRLVS